MKYRLKKNIIIHHSGDKVILFDNKKYELFTLNSTAADMLKAILKHKDEEKIISILIKKYDVSKNKIRKDLQTFIKTLKKNKIVEEKPS